VDYVFGYGSLARRSGRPAALRGHRRCWGVAMDNSRTSAGYKYYVDAHTGERPDVFVAFLDIHAAESDVEDGMLLAVTAEELAALDQRERNYERVEVTESIDPRPGGRVWTYVGSEEGRARCERGLARGTLVVSAEYMRLVPQAPDPPCPVMDLRRIDL
jgi:hypothetical protein